MACAPRQSTLQADKKIRRHRYDRQSFRLTLGFTVCLSAFAVDVSIPAIPDVVDFFGAGDASGPKIVGLYLAGYALGQIPMGLLADRFGRLPILYAGMWLFVLASIGTIFANTMELLLAARFAQGVAGASAPVICRAMVRDISSGRRLAELTGFLVSSLAIATLSAPVIGSLLVWIFGWRAPFASSLILVSLTLAFMALFLRETHRQKEPQSKVSQQLLTSARAFFSSRVSLWGAFMLGFSFFGYMAVVAGLAQTLVDVFGFSSSSVGLVFSSAVVFYLISSQLARRVLHRFDPLSQLKFGFCCYFISIAIVASILLLDAANFWAFYLALIPFLIGMGVIFSNSSTIALAPLPRSAGFAASILGTIQLLLATSGAMLFGVFYARTIDSLLIVLASGATLALFVYFAGVRSPRLISNVRANL